MARKVAFDRRTPDSVRRIYEMLAAELQVPGARK
jgi:hypothetical protein